MLAAVLHTLAAILVFLLIRAIPMPGVDVEAMRVFEDSAGVWPFHTGRAVIAGGAILWLVIFRGLAGLLAREPFEANPTVNRLLCGLYLGVALLRGYALAISLETISGPFGSIVLEPGMRFRLLVAATIGAGAAVEWALADWISRRGVGRGPLILFAVVVLLGGATELAHFGVVAGRDGVAGIYALISLAAGIPLALVLFALSRKGTLTWPIVVKRGLVLTSPIDLLIVPYVAGRVTLELIQSPVIFAAEAQGAEPFAWLAQLDTMAALTTAAGITVWLMGRPSRGISAGYLMAALCAPMIAIVPVAAAIVLDRDASLARFIGRGRGFEGTAVFEVLLTAEGGEGGRDALILVQRLQSLGVRGKILESALGRVRLRLTGSENMGQALSRVLMRGKLSISPISREQGLLEPADESRAKYPALEVRQDYDGSSYYVARERAQLDELIAEARLAAPKESRIGVEKQGEQDAVYAAFMLEPEVLSERDLRSVRVTSDNDLGAPNIQLELTPEAAKKFGELTARMVRRKLAIVIDGEIMSAPVVQSRIDGGHVSISLGRNKSQEEQFADARALAAALESRAMSRSWSLASIAAAAE